MEVTRRRKKLLDDRKDRRGYSHLKEEALDRTMWRNRFRGGFGPVVRQNTERMNVNIYSSKHSTPTLKGVHFPHFFYFYNLSSILREERNTNI